MTPFAGPPKVALIGGGQIGANVALLATLKDLGEIVVFDIMADMAKGKALDMTQMCSIENKNHPISATGDYCAIQGAAVAIVTAGIARKPGMSRDELLEVNAQVMRQVAKGLREYCPDAFVICITNPLDAMVQLLQAESGLPSSHVCGMAGILDGARFEHFISEKLNIAKEDVHAVVMGGHGDGMVPLPRFCTVNGIPLPEFVAMGMITDEEILSIMQRTRDGGAEINRLLQTGSAFFAPAAAAVRMAKSYLHNERRLVTCAAKCNGEYGVNDLYVGVPAIIGKNGVEKIVELPLTPGEKKLFEHSIDTVRSLCDALRLIK